MRVSLRGWDTRYGESLWTPLEDGAVEMQIDDSVTEVWLSITNETGDEISELWIKSLGGNDTRHTFAPPNIERGGTVGVSLQTPLETRVPLEWAIGGRVPALIGRDLPDPTFKIIRMGGGQ